MLFYAYAILLSLSTIIIIASSFHTDHRVSCKYQKVCNGNLMCAFVCERGSVNLDSWIIQSLNYQKKLQRFDDMVFLEMPSTHNSAITEADGFGIEKYFISALGGGVDLDQGDDMREGVSQHLSITDQMRMGVRHVEIDIWWDELIGGVIVCHTPVVSPLKVEQINLGAQAANLSLVWEPKNTSCRGTKRTFVDVLTEVKDFMHQEENLEDVVVLFLDTKFYLSPLHVTKANKDILSVFGTMLWTYTDGNPFGHTVDDLLSKKKRVIIENNKEEWLHPSVGKPIVFFPPLWTHQFDSKSFEQFPSCSVEGDQDWYGNTWVRALADNTMTEAGTRCGVQLSSLDYSNPDDMRLYVWSWDQGEPSLPSSSGCAAMSPSGRWVSLDCQTKLPFACLTPSEDESVGYDLEWSVDLNQLGVWSEGAGVCMAASSSRRNVTFSVPHNGFSNAVLLNQAYGQTVWLNAPISFKK